MKRIAVLLLISVICLISLSACGEEKSSGKSIEELADIVQESYPEADCPIVDDENIQQWAWSSYGVHTAGITLCKDGTLDDIILGLDIAPQEFADLEMTDLTRIASLGFGDDDDLGVHIALNFLYDTVSYLTDSEDGIYELIFDSREEIVSSNGWNMDINFKDDSVVAHIYYVGEED